MSTKMVSSELDILCTTDTCRLVKHKNLETTLKYNKFVRPTKITNSSPACRRSVSSQVAFVGHPLLAV